MSDKADYPGHPEPERESGLKSKLKLTGLALVKDIFYLLSLIAVTVKMVLSGMVGALIALYFDRTIPEGVSLDGIWAIVLLFVLLFAAYHHLENTMKEVEVPSWD